MALLNEVHDKTELVVQWIQRLVIQAADSKVVDIAPPILATALRDFGDGLVTIEKVQTISEIPFPFPYSQTLTVMLLLHWFMTPMIAASTIKSWTWAFFVVFFSLWPPSGAC